MRNNASTPPQISNCCLREWTLKPGLYLLLLIATDLYILDYIPPHNTQSPHMLLKHRSSMSACTRHQRWELFSGATLKRRNTCRPLPQYRWGRQPEGNKEKARMTCTSRHTIPGKLLAYQLSYLVQNRITTPSTVALKQLSGTPASVSVEGPPAGRLCMLNCFTSRPMAEKFSSTTSLALEKLNPPDSLSL